METSNQTKKLRTEFDQLGDLFLKISEALETATAIQKEGTVITAHAASQCVRPLQTMHADLKQELAELR